MCEQGKNNLGGKGGNAFRCRQVVGEVTNNKWIEKLKQVRPPPNPRQRGTWLRMTPLGRTLFSFLSEAPWREIPFGKGFVGEEYQQMQVPQYNKLKLNPERAFCTIRL